MALPWREVNAVDTARVAEELGLVKARERHKWGCPACGSSDSLHRWPARFICFAGCDWRFYSNVDLAAVVLQVEPIDAMRFLAERFGIPIPDWAPGDGRTRGEFSPPPPPRPRLPTEQEVNLAALAALPNPRFPPALYRDLVGRLSLTPLGRAYLGQGGASLPADVKPRGLDAHFAERYGFRSLDTEDQWTDLAMYLAGHYRSEELRAAGFPLYTPEELEQKRLPTTLKRARVPWGGRRPMIVIPYWHDGQLVGIRFNNYGAPRDPDTGKAKEMRYLSLPGVAPDLPFNADAIGASYIHVVEGEYNAFTLLMPPYRQDAIGLPGAGVWKPEWTTRLSGAKRLIAWYDEDRAGKKAVERLRATLVEKFGEAWTAERLHAIVQPRDPNDLHQARELRKVLIEAPWRARSF